MNEIDLIGNKQIDFKGVGDTDRIVSINLVTGCYLSLPV